MLPVKFFFSLFGLMFLVHGLHGQIYTRTDTLPVHHTENIPSVDGSGDDGCWENVEWISVSEVWMPYNNDASNLGQESGLKLWKGPDDFSGKIKVIWAQKTNLLYFLAEITDDVFINKYIYNENPGIGGDYPNYDILEIFIDENRSGGLHVFDGTGGVAGSWGTNAENAFSFHLAADAPEDGQVQTLFHALDIAGTNWGYPNQKIADYASHFPEFILKKEGNKYIWEFSLGVYDENYDHANPAASLITLESGKIMGLSLAYCDNDDLNESPLRRDHFYGSVNVPLSAYNDHWKQADWFGVAKLMKSPDTRTTLKTESQMKIECFVSNGWLVVNLNSPKEEKVDFRLLNIHGREVVRDTDVKPVGQWNKRMNIQGVKNGIYLVEITHENRRSAQKIIVQ
jgi:hypothetical protein